MGSFKTIDEMSLEELQNDLVNTNKDINFIQGKIGYYNSQLHMKRIRKYDLEYRISHFNEMNNKK